jgi:biotin transport system substrate-specific component
MTLSTQWRTDLMNTTLAPTILARYLPRTDRRLLDIMLILIASTFVSLMAQVRIPLPFTPVPITGQTFAVLLTGIALGSRRGSVSMLFYLILGVVGLPVFAGSTSGLAILAGPTGGYLVGFICAAWVVGRLAERNLDRSFRSIWLVFLIGEVVIYLFGLPWLSLYVGVERVFIAGFLPFLPGDIVKLAAATITVPSVWKLLEK